MQGIKFIDLRNSGIGYKFAFWDITYQQFLSFIEQRDNKIRKRFCFSDWDDFLSCSKNKDDLEEYANLCPDWVFEIQD